MTLNQISVFVENKPGKLQMLTDVLARHHVNLRALSLAETAEFGIVRIIVDDLNAARTVLTAEGFVHTTTRVLGVSIPDEPGGLNRVLQVLSAGGVNIEYMYAFLGGKDVPHAYMIFHVQDVNAAVSVLASEGIMCIMQDDLAAL